MVAIQLDQLELFDAWYEGEKGPRWRGQFPLMSSPEIQSFGAVYFELDPDESLPIHTDSKDEIVVLLEGSGEGRVGDETCTLSSNGFVFIPAMVEHGFTNTGSTPLKALGIFAGAHVVSTFEQEVQPIGVRVFGHESASVS